MDTLTILLKAHSGVRWLVVLGIVIVLARFAMLWVGGKAPSKSDGLLLKFSTIVVDIQVTLGVVMFVLYRLAGAGALRLHLEHAVIMLLAAAAIHLPRKWRAAAPGVFARNTFLSYACAVLLVFVGVLLLPKGW